jgi:type IV secretion system protein VirB10
MNLFGPRPTNTPAGAPTVSTAPGAPQLGFWQRNRKGLFLFGGCVVLLITSRFLASNSREAKQEAKAQKVVAAATHEETDKGDQIASLQVALAAQRQQQQEKAQEELAAAMAASQLTAEQKRVLGGSTPAVEPPTGAASPRPAYYNSAETEPPVPTQDKAETLVISYRGQSESSSPTQAPATSQLAAPSVSAPEAAGKKEAVDDREHQLAAFTGEKYRIREGTWIPCTEMLRIDGSFASDINCLVAIPIYSVSGSRLLIPQGTLALGHVHAVSSQNQQRLFVVFDRFIMPDGFTVTYENAAGLDQIGQTGLRDKVNHHYIQMFGASVALAAIGGLAQIGNYGNANITAGSQYRSGLTQGLSESSIQILDRFSNVLPTFTIREGARNNIHLPFNLWLPDYSHHTMKGDL